MVTSGSHNAVHLNMHSNISRSDTLRGIAHQNNDNAPPSIAALFLIEFDIRKGYSVTWKQSMLDVELDGLVEYKSLPSGLHNVREDLMYRHPYHSFSPLAPCSQPLPADPLNSHSYFVHGDFAGQSAFINVPDDSEHRNARMFAVGVLVPLKRGRLGKAWMHIPALKDIVQ
ncbi:hypothetical protein KEM54_005038 [Ascosphaera aggregata]|nr:hypothetical protein KEM54_005038 [Ascosphaera aggregata]